MTEHKFTDEEVIKALELHSTAYEPCLDKCVYGKERCCGSKMAKDALDLINRQRAEIEELIYKLECLLCHATGSRLSKHTYDLRTMETVVTDYINEVYYEGYDEAKSEAIKEYLAKVLEKKDTASHYAPGTEVVTVGVMEHYARQFAEGSGE